MQSVQATYQFKKIDNQYKKYDKKISKRYTIIPNVKGMTGMDAVALLENIGLKVRFSGTGKVTYQSLAKGQKLVKGSTIILKLS